MKDLRSSELRRYRVSAPIETLAGFNTMFPNSKVYSFEFPTTKEEHLKTIVSEIRNHGHVDIRISISAIDNHGQSMRAVTAKEIYRVNELLQESDESMVWQYNPVIENLRSLGFRACVKQNFDMNSFVLHTHQYDGELPPLEEAYNKKMQKNRGLFYSRGTSGEWKYIHILVKDIFPWAFLEKVAEKEFKNNLVQVFFNKETKEHPNNEFVIWYNPNAKYLV